jgi:hypothetical protein
MCLQGIFLSDGSAQVNTLVQANNDDSSGLDGGRKRKVYVEGLFRLAGDGATCGLWSSRQ